MKKITALAIVATAQLTACTVDPADSTAPAVSADGQFTLDTGAFSVDSGRLMTTTSGPLLEGTIESRSVPRAFVIVKDHREAVGTAIVHDDAWSLQLPAGTISLAGTRVVLEADIAPSEPSLIEQTFALAEIEPNAAQ